MKKRALIGALLLIGVGVVLGATVFRADIAQATGLAQAVTVANTTNNPVPVQQQGTASVNVTNTSVPVHEQGTANVNVTGTASVEAADETQALLTANPSGNPWERSIDVSAYRQIRINAAINCAQNGSANVLVYSVGSTLMNIDSFTVGCVDTTRTYEVPGTTLLIRWYGGQGFLDVYGRAN
jgi:hypothetical protein